LRIRTPKLIKKLFSPWRKLYNIIWNRVKKSIRLELVAVFGVCLVISSMIGGIVGNTYKGVKSARIEYTSGIRRISQQSNYIGDTIKTSNLSITDKEKIEQIIASADGNSDYKILICDLDGKVLYKSNNASETEVDIYTIIKNVMDVVRTTENGYGTDKFSNKEVVSFYPVNFIDGRGYAIVSGIPEGHIVYYNTSNDFPAFLATIASFLLSFYFITNKKMKYIEKVSNGLLEISKGNLDYRIERHGDDELASLAANINFMAQELKDKIENERKAEKTKSELITNVSHDLRTPLTSIKGYLGLIKDKKYNEYDQLEQYVNIAYNKSEKLEVLINDLFEYTKLSSSGINLDKQYIALNDLLDQLIDELVPISEENDVNIYKEFINEKVSVNIDPIKTVRVFENLLMNAIRYSLKPGEIRVILTRRDGAAVVSIENSCDSISEEDLGKIFDRFYRVEKSRASDMGGSGLGLAIAKNIVELQGGYIEVKHKDGYICFQVTFRL
jgi:signal transduction histidine kinase